MTSAHASQQNVPSNEIVPPHSLSSLAPTETQGLQLPPPSLLGQKRQLVLSDDKLPGATSARTSKPKPRKRVANRNGSGFNGPTNNPRPSEVSRENTLRYVFYSFARSLLIYNRPTLTRCSGTPEELKKVKDDFLKMGRGICRSNGYNIDPQEYFALIFEHNPRCPTDKVTNSPK